MAYTSVFEGIVFVEGQSPKANVLGNVQYSSHGRLSPQLKNLNHVKQDLARQAKSKKCNCIVDFQYGQKSSFLSFDDVKWWGKGKCAKLPAEEYERILSEKQ